MTTLYSEAAINIVNTTIVDNWQVATDAVLSLYKRGSIAWLRGVTFARNNAPRVILSYYGSEVYSDMPMQYYSGVDGQYVTSLSAPSSGAFLSPQDVFFVKATAVRCCSHLPVGELMQ
eukprot:jgi/Ulvmu1/8591/UM045_0034.1